MKEHGELLLTWEGSILIIKANGYFNEEGALAGISAIKQAVESKQLTYWHRLGYWNEQYLGSPTTMAMFKEAHEWCRENGCQKVAVIVCNSFQQDAAEAIFSGKAKVFREEIEAIEWLNS